MKNFWKMFRTALIFCLVMIVLCSFIYPLALTGVSQLTMKEKANGSLIDREGNLTADAEEAVGSALLGQDFTEDYFFHGRVSSIHYNTYTQEQKDNGEYAGVASGSGLDPHISPEAAEVQIDAVAHNSGLDVETVTKIVEDNTEHRFLGVFGEERVNVLKCNLDIAAAMGIL